MKNPIKGYKNGVPDSTPVETHNTIRFNYLWNSTAAKVDDLRCRLVQTSPIKTSLLRITYFFSNSESKNWQIDSTNFIEALASF